MIVPIQAQEASFLIVAYLLEQLFLTILDRIKRIVVFVCAFMVVKKLFKFLAFFVSFQSDDPLDVSGIDLEIISSETFDGKCYPEIALV